VRRSQGGSLPKIFLGAKLFDLGKQQFFVLDMAPSALPAAPMEEAKAIKS